MLTNVKAVDRYRRHKCMLTLLVDVDRFPNNIKNLPSKSTKFMIIFQSYCYFTWLKLDNRTIRSLQCIYRVLETISHFLSQWRTFQ